MLFPNCEPIVEGTIYRPPNQTNFLEIFHEKLSKVDINNIETCILGDFNSNWWQNGRYVFQNHNLPLCQPRPQSNFKKIALAPHHFAGNLYLI